MSRVKVRLLVINLLYTLYRPLMFDHFGLVIPQLAPPPLSVSGVNDQDILVAHAVRNNDL
jgi:hypothetical protein